MVLAGGRSRRMGQNKALMHLGNDTIIAHVIRQMQAVTNNLLLITNTPDLYAHLGLPMHADLVPNMGTLGGIYTGLTYAASSAALCVGCDMPLLQPGLLSHLITILEEYDAVVPCVQAADRPRASQQKSPPTDEIRPPKSPQVSEDLGGRETAELFPLRSAVPIFQTLSAVYSKRCLPVIDQMLTEGELRVHALYERICARIVEPEEWQSLDPQGLSFFNINTPEDLEKAIVHLVVDS